MRLGPILQAIVTVPELAPAAAWVESTLGLTLAARGRFPREVALTLGAPAWVDAPCMALGLDAAEALLLLVEDPTVPPESPTQGWTGLGLQRPGAAAVCRGLGLEWILSDGAPGLVSATLTTSEPLVSRGYYQGLGALPPRSAAPWILPLCGGELRLESTAVTGDRPDRRLTLVLARGSASAVLPGPAAHGQGSGGEWFLLRAAPVQPEVP
jgi:hypothetical protein